MSVRKDDVGEQTEPATTCSRCGADPPKMCIQCLGEITQTSDARATRAEAERDAARAEVNIAYAKGRTDELLEHRDAEKRLERSEKRLRKALFDAHVYQCHETCGVTKPHSDENHSEECLRSCAALASKETK
jgi:CRISPR/Cas system-associated protein Cas10 (large subunit of type III CRISPR-Cas system)